MSFSALTTGVVTCAATCAATAAAAAAAAVCLALPAPAPAPAVRRAPQSQSQSLPQAPPRAAAPPASAPSATGVIAGVVVADDARQTPVRRARITLRPAGYGNGWSTTTDDAGRFVLSALPADRYTLQASKPAWIAATFGAPRAGRAGTPIALAAGQRLTDVTLTMQRGGVITGTVVDSRGQPMPGVGITLLRAAYSPQTGEKAFAPAASATTDDRGAYRAYGLTGGDYLVLATLRAGPPTALVDVQRITEADVQRAIADAGVPRATGVAATSPGLGLTASETRAAPAPPTSTSLVGYAPVYFPGTVDASAATPVTVRAGAERTAIDIRLDVVPTTQIQAIVSVPDPASLPSVQVYMVSGQPAGLAQGGPSMQTGRRDADGRITFSGITPGTYTLVARAASPRAAAAPPTVGSVGPPILSGRGRGPALPLDLYATAEVVASGGTLSVPLTLESGLTVGGRLAFDGAAPPTAAELAGIRLTLAPITRGPALTVPPAPVGVDGAFIFTGVPAGQYRLDFAVPATLDRWIPVSSMAAGRDVLDTPLDLRAGVDVHEWVTTFTDRPSRLTGRLEQAQGRPATDYFIIVFTPERMFWTPLSRRVRQARPDSDGTFLVRGLPAGDYFMAALTDVEPGEWYDPAFLASLAGSAIRVTMRDGAETIQNLRISSTLPSARRLDYHR